MRPKNLMCLCLSRAIEESMMPSSCSSSSVDTAPVLQVPFSHEEEQLRLALELSQKYQEEAEKRRQEEEEELQKILALSLMEK
ncbi:hypothetical protein NP493_577g01045 [Ridgeia piscesae]|uniref:Uncharacterized protein n=1 Tax=Ridgeia piscesae TaxID=27915 RepID=A0AAD9KUA4_RIDPI|nr:hypothetical protein NP493_577g01045 [Ridgeia piscesae]